jgi:aminoglycoside phosphotransferase (APT) family kinase protein
VTNDFVNERHNTFQTPESAIFQLVRSATGQTPLRRQKIVAGCDNEVYCVATAHDKEFIVRIRRFGNLSFEQEAWAMERCRAAGVPVPDILSVTTLSEEGGDLEAMVLNKVDGVSLADLKSDPPALEKLLIEAGAILRKIHSVKADGFYHRHDGGRWDFPDWESCMDSSIRDRSEEREFILKAGFSPAEFDTMLAAMKNCKTCLSGRQPVLNHGDYLPGHIFVKDGRISGVIDFGDFQGAPPVHDFSIFSMQDPSPDLRPLLRGYTDGAPPDDRFTTSLSLYQVGLQMGYLAHYVKSGNIEEAERLGRKLKKTLHDLPSTGTRL